MMDIWFKINILIHFLIMNLKTNITEIHYNKNAKGFFFNILKLCSVFYGIGSKTKNFLYDNGILKPKKVNAFVVSVGNFTTGGVGKTPVVAEIAKYYLKLGEKPAIISRGYGGKLNNKTVHVISDGINLYYKANEAGDEPYWLGVNLDGCAVLTCANRYNAAKYAINKLGCTKIILDDGFQHRKLHRDLDIVLVDSKKMFGNGNLLPAGPLREGMEGFKRIHKLIIVSKNKDHSRADKIAKIIEKQQNVDTVVCKTEPNYVYNIITGEHLSKGAEITALSAIGQPDQFYQFLDGDYIIKDKITFDDHHKYILDDIKYIEGNIVTTEKDAVKLALLNRPNIYALKLKTIINVEGLLN